MQKVIISLPLPSIIHERIRELVSIVCGMILTVFFLPALVVGWEEGVSLCWRVVDFRETEAVGYLESLSVDTGATDDIDILIRCAVGESFFQRGIDITALKRLGTTAEHDIPAIG